MSFRSHIGRSLDITDRGNVIMLVIVAATAVTAVVFWLNGEPGSVLLAPVQAFISWAVLREIDPDHSWTALGSAAAAGAWALRDGPLVPTLAIAGLVLAARLVSGTTGRRPLPVDLTVVAIGGTVIGFTVEGWIAGFGIAIALYLDDRLSGFSRVLQVTASAMTAVGVTIVATLTGAFPRDLPLVVPYLAIAAGLIALLLVVRDPAPPRSVVDARHGALVDATRLHYCRSLVGILVFAMALAMGPQAEGAVGIMFGLFLAISSNELELAGRARQ